MTKKTKPAGLESGEALREKDGGLAGLVTPAAELQASVELHKMLNPEPDAEDLLVDLEQRCMSGGSVGLDDIRAVLAKLRG